jgi:hypothetical protein
MAVNGGLASPGGCARKALQRRDFIHETVWLAA